MTAQVPIMAAQVQSLAFKVKKIKFYKSIFFIKKIYTVYTHKSHTKFILKKLNSLILLYGLSKMTLNIDKQLSRIELNYGINKKQNNYRF